MLSFPSYYYGLGGCSNGDEYLQGVSSVEKIMSQVHGGGSTSSFRSTVEAKAVAACKSHSEAERRRRERINGHLATLRTLLPNMAKTDKASLLAKVVQHVRELKKLAAEVAVQDGDGCSSSSRESPFPGETDELTLGYCEEEGHQLVKVSLCCDDRPDLFSDLTRALRSVQVRVVKAEMSTLGGRTKSVFLIHGGGGGGGGGGGDENNNTFGNLRRALKAVLDKHSVPATLGQVVSGNKRPRFSLATHCQ